MFEETMLLFLCRVVALIVLALYSLLSQISWNNCHYCKSSSCGIRKAFDCAIFGRWSYCGYCDLLAARLPRPYAVEVSRVT